MASTRNRSIADIQAEIQRLQTEADALQRREVEEVIGKIKVAIAEYGFPRFFQNSKGQGL